MIPEDQISQIKSQIISQIDSNFPEEQKQSAKEQIETMDAEQLEEFLKQNQQAQDGQSKCIFCSITGGEINSYKVDEDEESLAILEINPISMGHVIIIPKKHISSTDEIPKTSFALAEKIAKKIKTKFKPKDVLISSSNAFGHAMINVLPVYENETLNSKRKQASEEELKDLEKKLKKVVKPVVIKKPKPEKLKEKVRLPKRIP